MTVRSWAVSPAELREALDALGGGGDGGPGGATTPRFSMSEMHDASEVLGEIFTCLHRCDGFMRVSTHQLFGLQSGSALRHLAGGVHLSTAVVWLTTNQHTGQCVGRHVHRSYLFVLDSDNVSASSLRRSLVYARDRVA